jgi:transposase
LAEIIYRKGHLTPPAYSKWPKPSPTGTIYITWDNASTHFDDDVESVSRAAAGRLVLLYLPTYSPWLNPIEMM